MERPKEIPSIFRYKSLEVTASRCSVDNSGRVRECVRVRARVSRARLWVISSTHHTPLCRWTSCSLDSCRIPPQTPSARTHHDRPCNRRARHASACCFCRISTGTRRGRCLGATISICWPLNAMTSSEERTSAETNSSTLLHRKVMGGVCFTSPSPILRGCEATDPCPRADSRW